MLGEVASYGILKDVGWVRPLLIASRRTRITGFLERQNNILQEEKLALKSAANTYLKRLSVIWSSPLSDSNRILASNQLALPVLSYLMWSQHWNLSDLRNIDRQERKIICDNGGKHPLGSTALVYFPRTLGGRGLRSVETGYKQIKVKSAIKLYSNKDPTMSLVRALKNNPLTKVNNLWSRRPASLRGSWELS